MNPLDVYSMEELIDIDNIWRLKKRQVVNHEECEWNPCVDEKESM